MTIIPEVGDWVTLKTDIPCLDSEAGKVLEVDRRRQKFRGIFFTEDDGGPCIEEEEWFEISKIHSIITNPLIINNLEEDYKKCYF